jgi:hypothetical protein
MARCRGGSRVDVSKTWKGHGAGVQLGGTPRCEEGLVEMHPKRLSHVACGFPHSARSDHWPFTLSINFSGGVHSATSVAGKKLGRSSSRSTSQSSGGSRAEPDFLQNPQPSPPCAVVVFVASFLAAVSELRFAVPARKPKIKPRYRKLA